MYPAMSWLPSTVSTTDSTALPNDMTLNILVKGVLDAYT